MDFISILTNVASAATILSLAYDIIKDLLLSKNSSTRVVNNISISNRSIVNNYIRFTSDTDATDEIIIFCTSLIISATIFKIIIFVSFCTWFLLFITSFIILFSKKLLFNSVKDKFRAYTTLVIYIIPNTYFTKFQQSQFCI